MIEVETFIDIHIYFLKKEIKHQTKNNYKINQIQMPDWLCEQARKSQYQPKAFLLQFNHSAVWFYHCNAVHKPTASMAEIDCPIY